MSRYRGKARSALVYSDEFVFCAASGVDQRTLRRRFAQRPGIEYKCVWCNVGSTYNDRPLVLQVDHINGDNRDNRIENLRWLCPNCQSQTPTYAGRNRECAIKTCREDGCTTRVKTRGLCNRHYLWLWQNEVKPGKKTWKDLEREGRVLPRQWEWKSETTGAA